LAGVLVQVLKLLGHGVVEAVLYLDVALWRRVRLGSMMRELLDEFCVLLLKIVDG